MVRFLLVLTVLFVVLLSLAPVAVGSQSYGSAVPAAEADSVAADFIAALDLDVARLTPPWLRIALLFSLHRRSMIPSWLTNPAARFSCQAWPRIGVSQATA